MSEPVITPVSDLKKGVVEQMRFGRDKVRIRRRGQGKAGRADATYGLPWILEHREPGDLWSIWRTHNLETSAQWDRWSVWGGPEPAL